MEKNFSLLILFFVAVACISLAGFYSSYLGHLPDMGKFRPVIHIHFLAFLCWLLLIIIQPVLIKKRKYNLHRLLGKFSYLLAPILVTTMTILVYQQTKRVLTVSQADASIIALIGLLDIISFSAYYLIAMINRKNMRWHVAFILAATLIILNPGMSRLLNVIKPGLGLPGAILTPFIIAIAIILFEKIKLKRAILKSPYFIFLLCWTMEIIILITFPDTTFWNNFIRTIFS